MILACTGLIEPWRIKVKIREGFTAEAGVLKGELFGPWGKREGGMSEAVERSRRLEDDEGLRCVHGTRPCNRDPAAANQSRYVLSGQ